MRKTPCDHARSLLRSVHEPSSGVVDRSNRPQGGNGFSDIRRRAARTSGSSAVLRRRRVAHERRREDRRTVRSVAAGDDFRAHRDRACGVAITDGVRSDPRGGLDSARSLAKRISRKSAAHVSLEPRHASDGVHLAYPLEDTLSRGAHRVIARPRCEDATSAFARRARPMHRSMRRSATSFTEAR